MRLSGFESPACVSMVEVAAMIGVIRTRDVVANWPLIWREFGGRCLARCVWRSLTSKEAVTFIQCLWR